MKKVKIAKPKRSIRSPERRPKKEKAVDLTEGIVSFYHMGEWLLHSSQSEEESSASKLDYSSASETQSSYFPDVAASVLRDFKSTALYTLIECRTGTEMAEEEGRQEALRNIQRKKKGKP